MLSRLTVDIEPATVDDADALIAVQNSAFADDLEHYGECPSYIQDRDLMLHKLNTSIFYKLVADGEIVGGVELHKRSETHYHIYMLCVHPDYHDRGVGFQALDFIFNAHPGVTCWTLVTPSGNQRSRHLYEKAGFIATDQRVHSPVLTLVCYERRSSKLAL